MTVKELAEIREGCREGAVIAAELYHAFQDVSRPGKGTAKPAFTADQAFELTRTVLYDALKDAKVLP
jgi:hypothetical protein